MKVKTTLNGHVLIRPRAPEATPNFVIPDSVDQEKATIGEVIVGNAVKTSTLRSDSALGEGYFLGKGDVVMFNAFAPRKVEHEGEECLLVSGEDIYAVIEA